MDKNFNLDDLKNKLIVNGLDIIPGGFLVYRADDENDEILYVNSALLKIYECDTEKEFMELTGGTFSGMVYKEDLKNVIDSINNQIQADHDHYDQVNYRIMTKKGHVKYVEDFGRFQDDPEEGPLFYVFISDIQSMQDPLTGLTTRWGFFNKAEIFEKETLESGQRPVMMAFDLSGMKGFNARFGVNEGDRLLCIFADILRKIFGNDKCSRFGEDHFFAFTVHEGLEDKIKALIQDLCEANRGMTLPVKIGTCSYHKGISVHLACDYARMACDAQKAQYGSSYGSFDEKMAERYAKAEYILSHLDQAINEGWIHVYLQPVVRALTGRVCSCEALARWIDPVYGFISPGDFVPLIEENGMSYKLDKFIVKRVVEMLSRDIKAGNPVVPVSVNVSRSDFDYCDPVDIIVNALDERNVRRNLICVEITETALMNDTGLIRKAIERFHEAGIEIWMDDFGSGYSSLNILKDFEFDEIKIDMVFLKDFSDKSKSIITMAVKMAKELGIHTLAEGVETREQLEFLKSIGCEKIQGYYYSKPMALSDIRRHLSESGLIYETREVKSVYEKTGLIDVVTNQAIAMFFYSSGKFSKLYSNKHFDDILQGTADHTDIEIEANLNRENTIMSRKFCQLAEKTIATQQEQRMIYIHNGRYYSVSFLDIADSRQGSMLRVTVDCSEYEDQEKMQTHDYIMRNVISAFDSIYLLDFKKDTRKVIYSNLLNEKVGDELKGLHEFYSDFCLKLIYPDDRSRWLEFVNPALYKKPVNTRSDMTFSEVFRVKDENGNFNWTEFLIILISDTVNRRALVCARPSEVERHAGIYHDASRYNHNSDRHSINDNLMDAVIRNSGIRFFWKDKNRRFMGVTQSFLDFYGFASPDVVIGKTDEEVGWHIDDTPFMSDEERVLKKGEVIRNAIGQNVVDGVTRYIAATKFPVYDKGKIVGLMGYMIDVERDAQSGDSLRKGSLIDTVTGCMNAYGQMITLTQLDDNLRSNGEEFVYAVLEVPEFEDIRIDYGREIADKYINTVFEMIVDIFGRTASIFRTYGCHFGVAKRNISTETIELFCSEWKQRVDNLREIDGRQIMMTGTYAFANGTEKETVQELVDLVGKRLQQKIHGDSLSDNYGSSVIKDYYDNMPLPYVVAKPIMDKDGKTAVDIEYLYANYKYCEVSGKNASEIIGNRYSKLYPRVRNTKWIDIAHKAAAGEYIYDRTFSYAIKHWVNFISSPGSQAGTFTTVFMNMDEDMQRAETSVSNHDTDAANINIAKILEGDMNYEVSVRNALKEIGDVIKADRVFIFKNNACYIYNNNKMLVHYIEWTDYGIKPNDESYVNELNDFLQPWKGALENKKSITVEDVDTIKENHPDGYNYLRLRDVKCMTVVPMIGGNNIIGYLCAYNYINSVNIDVLSVMENAAYFISSKIMLQLLKKKERKVNLENFKVQRRLETENTAIRIAKILSGDDSYEDAMNKMLNILKESITAERLFIMEVKDGTISNTFEWCDESVDSVIDRWQNISLDSYSIITDDFKPGSCNVISDVEKYKYINPLRANYLKDQSIRNVIEAPFYNNGVLLGYIGVDNYIEEDEENIKHLLENISLFIGFRVHNNALEKVNSALHVARSLTVNYQKTIREPEISDRSYDDMNEPDLFNDIPMAYVVARVVLDISNMQAIDFEFKFVNRIFCERVGKSQQEIEGKRYKELFFDIDPTWVTEGYQVAVEGMKLSGRKYSVLAQTWVDYHMIPGPDAGSFILTMADASIEYRKQLTLQKHRQRDKVLIEIAKTMAEEKPYKNVMESALRIIAKYFYASRVYVVTIQGGHTITEFQYCAKGIDPNRNQFDEIDAYFVENAKNNLHKNVNVIKLNINEVKEKDKHLYDFLNAINVRNMIGAPMLDEEAVMGYICVENYESGKIDEMEEFLNTISTFITHRLLEHRRSR